MNANSATLIALALPRGRAAQIAAQIVAAVAGTLLLTLSAKVKIPLGPVDLSLQTLAVIVIAAAFGMRLGVATVLLYLAEGAAGFPVFQGTPEKGLGLAYMVGPTGGFLLGFVAMAAIVGWAADNRWDRSLPRFFNAVLAAEFVMMAIGFAWLAALIGADKAWTFGVAPFILGDLLKVGLGAALMPAIWALLPKSE